MYRLHIVEQPDTERRQAEKQDLQWVRPRKDVTADADGE